MNGVVVIARIDGIDRQKRNRAQVFAAIHRRRRECLTLLHHTFREVLGNAVRVDRDQRNLALIVGIAEAFDDLGAWCRKFSAPDEFETDEIAIACSAHIVGQDRPAFQFLAVDRLDRAAAALRGPEDAEQTPFFLRQLFDRCRFIESAATAARQFRELRKNPVADADVIIGGARR